MIVQSRLSTSGLAATADAFREKPSEGSCPLTPFFGAATVGVFGLGLPDLPLAPLLPARGIDAFFLGLAMLRP
jgi:hypothetical protein